MPLLASEESIALSQNTKVMWFMSDSSLCLGRGLVGPCEMNHVTILLLWDLDLAPTRKVLVYLPSYLDHLELGEVYLPVIQILQWHMRNSVIHN
jgi:hypothetical protein